MFKHLCTARFALGGALRLHCRQRGQHKGCDLSIKVSTVPFTQSMLEFVPISMVIMAHSYNEVSGPGGT